MTASGASSAIAGLKSRAGARSSERRAVLSEAEMRDFAACVRATVGATSHSPISSAAIPTAFTIFRAGEFELIDAIGIRLEQVLHAEQEYRLQETLHPGEEIRYSTTLASVAEKKGKGAALAFLAFETEFVRVADGATVAFARSTMVYREPA